MATRKRSWASELRRLALRMLKAKLREAGEDAGIAADARAILAHGDVAAVVRGVLDGPVVPDGGALGRDDGGGEVEGGLRWSGARGRCWRCG